MDEGERTGDHSSPLSEVEEEQALRKEEELPPVPGPVPDEPPAPVEHDEPTTTAVVESESAMEVVAPEPEAPETTEAIARTLEPTGEVREPIVIDSEPAPIAPPITTEPDEPIVVSPPPPAPPISSESEPEPIASTSTLSIPLGTHAPTNPSPLKRDISLVDLDEFEEAEDPFLNEESAAFKAVKSASEWNGLLRWARKGRGPQWDWGTGQYHVDVSSPEYTAGVTRINDSSLPSHLINGTPSSSRAFTPSGIPSTPTMNKDMGLNGANAGTYDSGRPRRTRANGR